MNANDQVHRAIRDLCLEDLPPSRMIYLLSRQQLICARSWEYNEDATGDKELMNRMTEHLIRFLDRISRHCPEA